MKFVLFLILLIHSTYSSGGALRSQVYFLMSGDSGQYQTTELISARYTCKLPQKTVNLYFLSPDSTLLSKENFIGGCKRTFFISDPSRTMAPVYQRQGNQFVEVRPTNSPQVEAMKKKQEHFFRKLSELRGSNTNANVIMMGEDMYEDAGCDAETIANQVINYVNPTTAPPVPGQQVVHWERPITVSDEERQIARSVVEQLKKKCNELNTVPAREWKHIDGGLKQISVGYRGIVCGVNINDHIFCRLSANSHWFHIPGLLKQISVSKTDYTICGVNRGDEIFCRIGTFFLLPWIRIEGRLKWISVYSEGNYWGVNVNDHIFRSTKRVGVHPHWFQVDGLLKQVSIGFNSQICGVNRFDQIFCRTSPFSHWIHIPGSLKDVSVSAVDNSVCGVNVHDQIFCRNSILNSDWYHIPGGLKNLESYGNGNVWGVNRHDQIFNR